MLYLYGFPEFLNDHNVVILDTEKINSMTTENCECILVTCDSHEVNYLESMEGNKLPVEHCIARTEGWLIEKSVMEALMNA